MTSREKRAPEPLSVNELARLSEIKRNAQQPFTDPETGESVVIAQHRISPEIEVGPIFDEPVLFMRRYRYDIRYEGFIHATKKRLNIIRRRARKLRKIVR